MSEQNYQIKIGSTADTAGIDKASTSAGQLGEKIEAAGGKSAASGTRVSTSAKQAADALKRTGDEGEKAGNKTAASLSKADQAAQDFVNSIKMGVGIDIGGKIVNSLAAIPNILSDAVAQGLAFNGTMQNAEIGIANVLAKFQNLDSTAAKNEAAKAMAKIVEIEPKAAGGLQDLVEGFLATVAAAQSAGISVTDNVELVGKFANALANANIPASQLAQEMRSILTGNINADSSLAKVLQIDNAAINKAKEAGTILQFLEEKIGALGNAGDSPAVAFSSFASAVSSALGKITAPIFDEIVQGAKDLTETLNNPASIEGLKNLGYEAAEFVKTGVKLTEWAINNAGTLALLGRSAGLLATALAAIKLAQLTQGLSNWARSLIVSKAAIDSETRSLGANTIAQTANTAAKKAGMLSNLNSKVAGSRAVGTAATVGLGAAFIGYEAAMGWTADKNRRTAESDALGTDLQKQGQTNIDLIKNLATQEEKQAAIATIMKQITALQDRKKDLTGEDLEMAERFQSIYEKQLGTIDKISDAYMAQKLSAREAAEEQKRIAEEAEKSAEAIRKFSSAQQDRQRARGINDLINSGSESLDTSGIVAKLAELQATLADVSKIAYGNAEGVSSVAVEAAQKEHDRLISEVEALAAAKESIEKEAADKKQADADKQKEKELEALQQRLDLEDAIAAKRIATLEGSGKTEQQIAAGRLKIEQELLATRQKIEDQRGAVAGETADQTQARKLGYETAGIELENRSKLAGKLEDTRSFDPERSGQRASRLRDLAGLGSYTRDGRTYDRSGNQVNDEETAGAAGARFRRQADGSLGESALGGRLGAKQKPKMPGEESAPSGTESTAANSAADQAKQAATTAEKGFETIAKNLVSLNVTLTKGLDDVSATLVKVVTEQKRQAKKIESIGNNV